MQPTSHRAGFVLPPATGARTLRLDAQRRGKPMRRRRSSTLEELRLTIDCLPLRTRVAMLEGVRANEIIVGAYADRKGGICPMLAAHRHGGRTSFISFAKA